MTLELQAQISELSVAIARAHIEELTTVFALWLEELDPSLFHGTAANGVEYSFQGTEDAASSARMVIGQTIAPNLALAASTALVMAYLHRGGNDMATTDEEANASIRAVARLAYVQRTRAIEGFVAEGRHLHHLDRGRRLMPWVLVGAVMLAVAWALLK